MNTYVQPDSTLENTTFITPEFNEAPVVVAESLPTKSLVVPEDAVKLSNGVYVLFKKLPTNISTEILLKAFAKANLDKKGNIITDNISTKDQISLAKNVSEYHSSLIAWGVDLVGDPEDYYEVLGLDEKWLSKLFRTGLIDSDLYDKDDSEDAKFLFLRWQAFVDAQDWEVLSQKLVANQ